MTAHVGILGGTGPAGSALAARLAAAGIAVTVGSRSVERATGVVERVRERWSDLDLPLEAGDNRAAASAELVVVATPWDAAAPTAASLADHLAGKVVVSMANALVRVGSEFAALVPPRGSVAAHVQAALPDASVAAAFHHVPARALADLARPLDGDVLVCSDSPAATKATSELVSVVPGLRALDAGNLANAAAVEAFTAVLLALNARYGVAASLRLTGIEH